MKTVQSGDLFAHARSTDPETSHLAAASISTDKITTQQKRILSLLAIRGEMTDEDIYKAYAGSWTPPTEQRLRTARSGLSKRTPRLVQFSGNRGTTRHGFPTQKWEITDEGRKQL